MTNEQIIYSHAMELVEEGKIREIDGMPEAIHTFQAWKKLGYCVKKGEKAVAQFYIWKCVSKETQNSDGMTEEQKRMFMKKASFFSASQVMAIE